MPTAWARPLSARIDQVDLARIAGHRHPRAFAQPGQHHLHLQARGVLGLVDDDEGVVEGAAAHEGDGRHLDLALVAAAAQLLGAQDVVQRLPDRRHIGIDLLVQVAGQEAQPLAGLHRRAGDDQPVDLAAQQQARAMGDGEEGLAGAGGPDAEHQVVAGQQLQIARLGGGLGGRPRRAGPAAGRPPPTAGSPAARGDGRAHVGLGRPRRRSRPARRWPGPPAWPRARALASPLSETPPPGVSTSTWKASSIRAAWRLSGPDTARSGGVRQRQELARRRGSSGLQSGWRRARRRGCHGRRRVDRAPARSGRSGFPAPAMCTGCR